MDIYVSFQAFVIGQPPNYIKILSLYYVRIRLF